MGRKQRFVKETLCFLASFLYSWQRRLRGEEVAFLQWSHNGLLEARMVFLRLFSRCLLAVGTQSYD